MFSLVFYIIAAVCILGALLQQAGLIATMRTHHREYYKKLGEPSWYVLLPWEILPSVSFLLYIVFGEFKSDATPRSLLPEFRMARLWYLIGIGFAIFATIGGFVLGNFQSLAG